MAREKMSRRNVSRSKKQKKGCGCNRSLRLWGGKHKKRIRSSKKSRKTVCGGGGEGFVIQETFPYQNCSNANIIPFNTLNGGDVDPTSPANVIDTRQTNPF